MRLNGRKLRIVWIWVPGERRIGGDDAMARGIVSFCNNGFKSAGWEDGCRIAFVIDVIREKINFGIGNGFHVELFGVSFRDWLRS